jgi:lysophospholipase-2
MSHAKEESCAKAGVIWLHGLGDSGAGWSFLRKEMSSLKQISWLFPDAPSNFVTLAGGRMPSWFDLHAIPVTKNTYPSESLEGILSSVEKVHAMVRDFQAQGIPSDRIVIGGFSQGAVVAVLSGLTMDASSPIAGIAAFSGWLPSEQLLASISKQQKPLNFLIAHGTYDDKVDYSLGQALHERLSSLGHSVQFKTYEGMGHSSCPEEIKDLHGWLSSTLP